MKENPSRRNVLASSGVLLTGSVSAGATTRPDEENVPLPMNPLGRTGVKVTRLGLGASIAGYDRRLLNYAYRRGVRYFDNAEGYLNGRAEEALGAWTSRTGLRDQVFVVSKSHSHTPEGIYRAVLSSIERMQIDTIDMYFLHALAEPEIPLDRKGEWRKLKERLQREKKVRFMGFSTHAEMPIRTANLVNAAKGGWIDALMTACDVGLIKKYPEFDKAIDTCAKAGVGLVCMKTTRGLGHSTQQPESARDAFKAMGLTPHEAMLKGMWSDGRFACVVSEMANLQQVELNTKTARDYTRPFDAKQREQLYQAVDKLARATCPGCDGRCRLAGGTQTDFCSIARYLCYYEHDGKREQARELFRALPEEARDWSGADLDAASRACPTHLDFSALLDRARRLLA